MFAALDQGIRIHCAVVAAHDQLLLAVLVCDK